MTEKETTASYDLIPERFPDQLSWEEANRIDSFVNVFTYVDSACDRAISWYYRKKKSKRILGYILRLFSIISVAAAGIIPVLGEILDTGRQDIEFSPAWSTIALAAAGLLITIDKFGGYTSGWIRFVRAAQALTVVKSEYRLEWEKLQLKGGPSEPDQTPLSLCYDYLTRVNDIVNAETNEWAKEFQAALTTLDRKSEADNG